MFCDHLSLDYFHIVFSHSIIISLWSRQTKCVMYMKKAKHRKFMWLVQCRQVVKAQLELCPQLAKLYNLRDCSSIPDCSHFWHHLRVVSKTTIWLNNLLQRLTELHWKLLCSWVLFLTGKGYRLKLAKGRNTWVNVREVSTHKASLGLGIHYFPGLRIHYFPVQILYWGYSV